MATQRITIVLNLDKGQKPYDPAKEMDTMQTGYNHLQAFFEDIFYEVESMESKTFRDGRIVKKTFPLSEREEED